jgi:hypothetical protein
MLLNELIFSLALLSPLSTLSLRLFFDVFAFLRTVKEKLERIKMIEKIQMELFKNNNVFQNNNSFVCNDNNLCKNHFFYV